MLNTEFDPLRILDELAGNQEILYKNDQQLSTAINQLQRRVEQQQATIDVLLKGLDAANRANELLMSQALDRMTANFSATGQH